MVKLAKDRRNWTRAKRVLSIEFKLKKSSRRNADKQTHVSTTSDMSIGGLSFYTQHNYLPDDVLHIIVTMAGVLDIFRGDAKVVRSKRKTGAAHNLIAVQFLSPKPDKKYSQSRSSKSKKSGKKRI